MQVDKQLLTVKKKRERSINDQNVKKKKKPLDETISTYKVKVKNRYTETHNAVVKALYTVTRFFLSTTTMMKQIEKKKHKERRFCQTEEEEEERKRKIKERNNLVQLCIFLCKACIMSLIASKHSSFAFFSSISMLGEYNHHCIALHLLLS